VGIVEEPVGDEREVVGAGTVEQRAQVDSVVRRARLLADHEDAPFVERTARDEELDELLTDHAVADDHEVLSPPGWGHPPESTERGCGLSCRRVNASRRRPHLGEIPS
jgi:hypothetical protein